MYDKKRLFVALAACLKNGAIIALLFVSVAASAESKWSIESGDSRVKLIELFTSHGCSSCPPAEKWLNDLSKRPGLWRRFVPLAFHVDYWDYIGWTDAYARPAYSKRQRDHARFRNLSSVYTPGFVVDGREWRGFFHRRPLPSRSQKAPWLQAEIDDRLINIVMPDGSGQRLIANVAILGSGFEDRIGRGENAGRFLRSDFVVLALKSKQSQSGTWRIQIPPHVDLKGAKKVAIAVWVSDLRQRPVQATGSWLPESWLR